MKIILFLCFSCLFLSISACQNTMIQHQSAMTHATLAQQINDTLQRYTWSYTSPHRRKPILVNISDQGTQIYGGCNQISKAHVLNGNHLKANPIQVQTLMGCGTLQHQEELASQIFTDANLAIQTTLNGQKQLKVSLKNGAVYNFQAIPAISDLKNYDNEILKKFTWQQISDEPSPHQIQILLVNFTADRMLFYAGCNGMSMQYYIENSHIIPKGDFRSQVKFCGNTQHELYIGQKISKPMSLQFDFSAPLPKLILASKYQPNMIFQAIPRKENLKLP